MSGFVYFIEAGGKVKIGTSKNVAKRVSDISTACPLKCNFAGAVKGGREKERELHDRFHSVRDKGEWFLFTSEMKEYLLENAIILDIKSRKTAGLEPAKHIIESLGGPTAVSRIAGVHRTRVSNWMRKKEDGGTGGTIPFKYAPVLIAAARNAGVDLTADDFLPKHEEVEK